MVDDRTRKVIEHGRRIRAVLRQPQFAPHTLSDQVALLTAVSEGVLDDVPLERIDAFCVSLGVWLAQHCPEAVSLDDQAATLSEDLHGRLSTALKALARTVTSPATADRP
jgi:F0F1-type ATP synthase alpha subunit